MNTTKRLSADSGIRVAQSRLHCVQILGRRFGKVSFTYFSLNSYEVRHGFRALHARP